MKETITDSTQATYNGAMIYCPKCTGAMRVKNFYWEKLKCVNCDEIFLKSQYQYDSNSFKLKIGEHGAVTHRLLSPQLEKILERTPDAAIAAQVIQKVLSEGRNQLHHTFRMNGRYLLEECSSYENFEATVYDFIAKILYEEEEKLSNVAHNKRMTI